MKKLNPLSSGAPRSDKRLYYKLEELQAICAKEGCTIVQPPKRDLFELKDEATGEWCWVINPVNERIVKTIRTLNRETWRSVLEYNIKRLKEKASKK